MRRISIAEARRISEANGLDGAIIVAFKGGQYKVVEYGATYGYCRKLRAIVDQIAEMIAEEV